MNQQDPLQIAITQPPGQLNLWVESYFSSGGVMNWQLLAFEIAAKTHRSEAREDVFAWAKAAISLYQLLADKIEPQYSERYLDDMMLLQTHLLIRYGNSIKSVVNPLAIRDWALSDVALFEQVVNDVKHWAQLPVERIRWLRHLKLRLGLLKRLVDANYIGLDNEVTKWLSIRPLLP